MAKNPTSVDSNAHQLLETSSRCVPERVIGTHTFEVSDFSLLDGMGIGKFVGSITFSIGGCDWNINVYPDGSKEEDNGAYVSVFLYLRKSDTSVVRVQFTLYLLEEKDGSVSTLQDPVLLMHTFASTGDDWGVTKFVEKSKLEEFLGRNNDSLTVKCDLTVIKESRSEPKAVINTVVIPPANDLHQDLARLLKDEGGADVTFEVDGKLFRAHRCLLAARSPVFKAELFGPMKEKDTEPIKVDDMEACIFEELLHFIYTDRMSDKCAALDSNVATQHLLVAADRYGLDKLRLMCEDKLCHGIDEQTVATTLALADQHSCMRLKDACLTFVASGDALGTVMETDGFKHLAASCPVVMVELLNKIAKYKNQ